MGYRIRGIGWLFFGLDFGRVDDRSRDGVHFGVVVARLPPTRLCLHVVGKALVEHRVPLAAHRIRPEHNPS